MSPGLRSSLLDSFKSRTCFSQSLNHSVNTVNAAKKKPHTQKTPKHLLSSYPGEVRSIGETGSKLDEHVSV